jgi:xanthine dehydrogenase accessory factor
MKLELLRQMNAARAARRACALVTRLDDGEQRFVAAERVTDDPLAVEREGLSYFLTVQVPPVRLVMIGAVHISQALCPIARIAGLDPVVIDPRTAFATPERFPDTPVIAEWPEEALQTRPLDRYTAICLLTHDPKIDDRALTRALKAECFYIGALGSRKTHARRLDRMKAEGFDDAALSRIHAPIGLDIGAESPAEIALSIAGEIVQALRKKPLRSERS